MEGGPGATPVVSILGAAGQDPRGWKPKTQKSGLRSLQEEKTEAQQKDGRTT